MTKVTGVGNSFIFERKHARIIEKRYVRLRKWVYKRSDKLKERGKSYGRMVWTCKLDAIISK